MYTRPLIDVLGPGEMGAVHARNLARYRNTRLGFACSRPDALAALATELHAEPTYDSYHAVLNDIHVIAVIIATPPYTHAQLIICGSQSWEAYIL